jgi:glycosyltransferase involved in cell wall biosynthesis
MSDPPFSVVIPSYNATATIDSAIDSVLAQTREDFELIVVDDGSTDETPELVERHCAADARVKLIRQENQGTAGARNTGVGASRGQFISFLDNDDLWMPNYLSAMSMALEEDPGAGFAYTDAWLLHDETKRLWRRGSLEHYPPIPPRCSAEEFLSRLIHMNFVMSSVTVRRSALEDVGTFDASLKGVDDYDLWLRIVGAGYRAVQAPGRLLIQRDLPDSQSKDELLMIAGVRAVMARVVEEYDVPEAVREVARQRLTTLDRWEGTVTGRDRFRAGLLGVRLRITGFIKTTWPSVYLRTTAPPDVAAAFPELARRGRSGPPGAI